jgi:hypothetical protein
MTRPKIPRDAVPIDIIKQTEDTYVTGKTTAGREPENQDSWETKTLKRKVITLSSQTLFHDIQLKVEEDDIEQQMQQKSYVDIATDGSYDQVSGISSYGWTMAINQTVVATGKGPAEAHPMLAEPFRAEVYAVAAAAFAELLVDHYQTDPGNHNWTFILNNTLVIQKMEALKSDPPTAKWHLTPDADILYLAHLKLQHSGQIKEQESQAEL